MLFVGEAVDLSPQATGCPACACREPVVFRFERRPEMQLSVSAGALGEPPSTVAFFDIETPVESKEM